MILENSKLRVELDDSARIISLVEKEVGVNVIDSPAEDPFMLILASDRCKENIAFGGAQKLTASSDGTSACFHADRLKLDNGRDDAGFAELSLDLRVRLDGEDIIFTADLDNKSGMRVIDFEYPRVGVIKSLGDGKPSLLWCDQVGKLYHNIGERLSKAWTHRENGSNCMKMTYPGMAMLGFMALLDRSSSMFVSINDPDFIAAELKVAGDPENFGAITLVVDKHLCLADGKMSTAPIKLKLYRGDWHHGADDYAAFINPLRPAHKKPDWVREMLGYFLVINKQQFGYEMWDYTTLPKLWELAKAHGFDTLGLFGWYDSGHDNNYPDLEVSESMGGEETLKANIKAVQQDGGHVTLYYQGHLIDVESDFFRNREGKFVASKNIWGSNYVEFYSKSHKSDFLGEFSRKMFALACPACHEWVDLMCAREKWIGSLGADGTLYDQIGGMPPYICFDESHPHDGNNPARALTGGQSKLTAALQKGAKEISPEFIFMSEHLTDLYSANLDAVHGIGNMPSARGDRAYKIGGEGGVTAIPELMRYICPDVIVTLRNTNPFIDQRAVGYAFVFNFPLEMELRYRQDKLDILADKFAAKREWAKRVSVLRKKYAKSLGNGRFVDDRGLEKADDLMIAKVYELADGRIAVTLWNDSDEAKTPDIKVAGRTLESFETLDGVSGELSEMIPNGVAVAIYR